MTPYPTKFCAFVGHQNIPQWLKLGWMVIADLGPTHGEYSVLMAWICRCECVKPTREEFDSTAPAAKMIAEDPQLPLPVT